MFEPDDPPPSSETPVVFDTVVGAPAPTSAVRASSAPRAGASRARRALAIVAPLTLAGLVTAALLGGARSHHASAIDLGIELAAPVESDDLEAVTPCPPGMALVARDAIRVCVDRWEASVVEVLPGGVERPHSPFQTPKTWTGIKVKAVSVPGVVPQAYVTRAQASLACRNAGKRLCRGDEWRTACEGPAKTTWPYGAKEDPKACNTHGKNPLSFLYGSSKRVVYGSAMQHPLLNTFPGTLAKTGSFERCTNDYGVFDMVGNLHEWTSDPEPSFRGGYYRDDKTNAPGCRYRTTAHGAVYSDYSTGFRCCADPE